MPGDPTDEPSTCGRNMIAASVSVKPLSPNSAIWWKLSAVTSIEASAVASARIQNALVRTASLRSTPHSSTSSVWSVGGSPSGNCPTADGRSMIPNQDTGTTTSAMVPAATSHAWRQPTSSITNDNATGTSAISAEEMVIAIPSASPRRRSNQREIATVDASESDP